MLVGCAQKSLCSFHRILETVLKYVDYFFTVSKRTKNSKNGTNTQYYASLGHFRP